MKRIIEHLYIGNIDDYNALGPAILRFSVLGACKEPLHRKFARMRGAAEDGYTLRAMPKDEPEYLFAERDHALYLNMIDARDSRYFPAEMIETALDFIETEIDDGRDVLIVCNKAESRSPAIAFMYLIQKGAFTAFDEFWQAEQEFKYCYYPNYNPGIGMREFTKMFWEEN